VIITDIEVVHLVLPLDGPLRTSKGSMDNRQFVLVVVETDSGLRGIGEAAGDPPLLEPIITRRLAPLVIGADPLNPRAIWEAMFSSRVFWETAGSVVCAMSAIELACWDLLGKAEGVPVYELLGGRRRDWIEVYASDLFWDEPSRMAQAAASFVEDGFGFVKCHLGAPGAWDGDLKRCAAIRSAIGDRIGFMIDVNTAFDVNTALERGRSLAQFAPFWYEEPIAPLDWEGHAILRRELSVPIATGENLYTAHGFAPLFEAQGCQYVMPDVARCGGLGQILDICRMAERHGIVVSPHLFGGGVALAATVHLMAASPETQLLEFDPTGSSLYEELLVEPPELRAGKLRVPDGVGLGVDLRESILNRYGT
jgi:D-galactarolactone cycloisomerase